MIDPKCKSDNILPYINAEGLFFPCCLMANEPDLSDFKSLVGGEISSIDLNIVSIDNVKNSKAIQILENTWVSANPFPPCQHHCGKNNKELE
jgi:hypothetical protein